MGKPLRERRYLVALGVDGRTRSVIGGMYWIDLVQDGDRWRALLNAVMNFGLQ
jgi:hypothetical protein